MPLADNITTTATATATAMPITTTSATLGHGSCHQDMLPPFNEPRNPSTRKVDIKFDKSQCLFCAQLSQNMDQNLLHMSRAHGLHVDPTRLLVDVGSLLAHLHLVIFSHHKCLYCGTHRSSHIAVQHHMAAKGHCKYNLTSGDSDLQDLFDLSPISPENGGSNLPTLYASNSSTTYRDKSKNTRRTAFLDEPQPNSSSPSVDQASSPPTSHALTVSESHSMSSQTTSHSLLSSSTRAIKQENTLNNQLAQLRAADRRGLAHLPASQQRALLLSHHKQTENARRSEQVYQSNLESASNRFNCLGKIRLIRKPPHTGNIHSLKR